MKALRKADFQNIMMDGPSHQIRSQWDDNEWMDYIKVGISHTLDQILEVGLRMYQFKTESKCVQGGSDFAKRVHEIIGISPSYARDWAKIGERHAALQAIADKLPMSIHILKEIASQPLEKIEWAAEGGFIHADMKREDLGVIKKYDPDKVQEEKEALEENTENSTTVSQSSSEIGSTIDSSTPEISFTEDDDTPITLDKEKVKEFYKDKKLSALANELHNIEQLEVGFDFYQIGGCDILFHVDSYDELMTLIAKILKFNNEQVDADIDQELSKVSETIQKDIGYDSSKSDSEHRKDDPLYSQAAVIVIKSQRASISSLQRKLKIGYNRAYRLIEEMEYSGIVSPIDEKGKRKVNVIRGIEK